MMKRITILAAILSLFTLGAKAQNDTLYIYENGVIVYQKAVSEVDSVIFYKPEEATNDPTGTFTDTRDGNIYNYVTIGDQVWMSENLKYLPSVVGPATGSTSIPNYYVYDYDGTDVNVAKATDNYATYGVLYNWPAAMNGEASSTANPSGIQGVCPAGWHLPSDAEWTELTDELGGESVAGEKLKATQGWSENGNGTDEYGFKALPGGYRGTIDGTFLRIGYNGSWWSSTDYLNRYGWYRYILNNGSDVDSYIEDNTGFSVRCVRD